MAVETLSAEPRHAGDPVVDFTLLGIDGETYSSQTARRQGMVLAVLFKTGCGACKYSLPYLQRLHEQYAAGSGGKFQVWGLSQDDAATTREFARQYGITFPLLLDSDLSTTVQYRISHVPDLYLLTADDRIADAVVGYFGRDGFNAIARQAAEFLAVPYVPIVRDEDDAPDIKPG